MHPAWTVACQTPAHQMTICAVSLTITRAAVGGTAALGLAPRCHSLYDDATG